MYIPEPKETPSGWRIQLRINGQSIPVLADTPKECKRQAALIKAQAQAAGKPVKKCDLTLSQAIDAYIAERSNTLSPSTVRGYRIIQRTRFQSTMPRVLSRISPSEWRGIVNDELGIIPTPFPRRTSCSGRRWRQACAGCRPSTASAWTESSAAIAGRTF